MLGGPLVKVILNPEGFEIVLYTHIFRCFVVTRHLSELTLFWVKFSPAKSCLCIFFLTNSMSAPCAWCLNILQQSFPDGMYHLRKSIQNCLRILGRTIRHTEPSMHLRGDHTWVLSCSNAWQKSPLICHSNGPFAKIYNVQLDFSHKFINKK